MALSPCNLYYGLGREHFPALLETQYEPLSDVIDNFDDIEKTLVLSVGGIVKIFPFSILVKHELVNDEANGVPIMIVYCFLADLTAVYSRRYCGKELTFAVSGYTYLDEDIADALESFVLWDRDTESLWWPITEKSVSGMFRGESMERYDESKWIEMRWGEVKENYPSAIVMKDNQTIETPLNWPPIYAEELQCY
jgi:hypothetical protein